MPIATLPKPARTIPKISVNRLLQASGAFQFHFDDLGIEIEGDFSAGRFDGVAEVTFWNDAEEGLSWFVGDITLECLRWNGKSYDVCHVTLEQDSGTTQGKLYLAIWGALTDGGWRDAVEAKVMDQL